LQEIAMKLDQWRPLDPRETELQTVGCRHSTPEICKNNRTEKKCAFVRPDNVCVMPPRDWKKMYLKLKQNPSQTS
jgi:hypothetical protein